MIIVTSEYVYDNIKLNETRNIVEDTLQEYGQKYGNDYHKRVKVRCDAKCLGKIKNKTKNITIESYNIIGELNKIWQSSKGMIKLIRIIEIKIVIKNRIYRKIMYHYFIT